MSYIIVHTTSEPVRKLFVLLRKAHPELFVLDISGKSKVMENNGIALSYLANLLERFPNEIFIWVAERITPNQFPKLSKKVGKWLSEVSPRGGRNLHKAHKSLNITKEELEKCKIDISVNLKE